MNRHARLTLILAGLTTIGVAAWAPGCLFAPNDCDDLLKCPGAGGGTSTSGSAGGEVGTSSVASSASSSGSGGSAGCAINHPGMGTCEYQPGSECGCPDPKTKCGVVDPKTGESDCVAIGQSPHAAWASCDTDHDCAAGTWCDPMRRVCKPICGTLDDCPQGAQCIPANDSAPNTPIPGLKACTSHCEPQSALPCNDGLTCSYDNGGAYFDCMKSQNKVEGAPCVSLGECGKGLLCVGVSPNYTCQKWCSPVGVNNAACPAAKPFCSKFATAVTYDGNQYGFCSSP